MAREVEDGRRHASVHPRHADAAGVIPVREAVVGAADDLDGVGEDEISRVVPGGARIIEPDDTASIGGIIRGGVEDDIGIAARLDEAVARMPMKTLDADIANQDRRAAFAFKQPPRSICRAERMPVE